MKTLKLARGLAVVAGGMDFCTGIGLVATPATMLGLMGAKIPDGASADVFLRWVGAFVAAVGASYLMALICGGSSRLRTTLELTALFRFAAGLFSLCAIMSGELGLGWAGVPAGDLALVAAQIWLVRRKGWDDV